MVVKLGGSLYNHVPDIITSFTSAPVPLLIIPGGGKFADEVRNARLSDEESHWAAINAMDRYGRYIASCGLTTTTELRIPPRTMVLLPSRCLQEADPLPHSWDVTSDTISAWIAGKLGLDLLVVKSVDGIRVNNSLVPTLSHPIETDVVDPLFIPYVLENRIGVSIINGSIPDRITRFLKGETVPGTRIGTTF
ncbi:MAG: uridylate kinase [Methanomicrobiales archaeon]|nr:uridylate kinase [Methanomicrobiales archaeon]